MAPLAANALEILLARSTPPGSFLDANGNDKRFAGGASKDEIDAMHRIDKYGPYGYKPLLTGAVIFTVVYGICAIILAYQSLRPRKQWWMLGTLAFGALAECAGNGVRIYSHFHPDVVDPYIAQQVILVLTPAFFAAAHFTILTKVCKAYGEKYLHPIKAKYLIPTFVLLDLASLGIQAGGSGQAAEAETNNEKVSTVNGYGNIVVVGLCIQLLGYALFNLLFVTFVVRVYRDKRSDTTWFHNKRMKTFLFATFISALFVLARSAFRTAEMAIGWIGLIATTEWYYLVFDATFVAIALIILCIFSPAYHLPNVDEDGKYVLDAKHCDKAAMESEMQSADMQRRDSSPLEKSSASFNVHARGHSLDASENDHGNSYAPTLHGDADDLESNKA